MDLHLSILSKLVCETKTVNTKNKYFYFEKTSGYFSSKKREGVGTSKITLSKGQNVESILKDDHNIERSERQKSERRKECQKCKNDF